MEDTMKYLICAMLLFSSMLYAEEQNIFFDTTIFYNCVARNQFKNVSNVIDGGAGFGVAYEQDSIYAKLNFTFGFSSFCVLAV